MPLPTTRVVTGHYVNPVTGVAATGRVVLSPCPGVWTDEAGDQVLTGGATIALVDGAFSQALVATDAAGVEPVTGRLWILEERIDGRPYRRRAFALDAGVGSIDVTDLVDADPGDVTYVRGPQGPTGPTGPQPPLGAAGAGPTIALKSDDPTTTNARTPTFHASSHASGGSDPVTPAAIGAATTGALTLVSEQGWADRPQDQGLLAWTYDPNMAGHVTAQSSGGVAGRITLVRIILKEDITWSNIWIGVAGLDAGASLANCYLGVYSAAGNLLGTTADISSSLMTGATAKALPLVTPFAAAAGTYFIAMLLGGTWTTNSLTFKSSGAGISVNAGLTAPNLRYSNMLTAQTSLPSSLTLASQSTTIINTGWASQWYGVS
ncbi:hypothetical protein [Streptomyces sp. NPDC048340]|uniref:hypothetical protein n=1 Tax=Streptomyces sp. NPDC048340 TaxID=3365537 RepID=UPI003714EFDF